MFVLYYRGLGVAGAGLLGLCLFVVYCVVCGLDRFTLVLGYLILVFGYSS